MISSVFLMQPVGQALAQIVGVLVLIGQDNAHGLHDKQCGLDSLHEEECKKIIDGTWRIVIGSGAVPALLAIIFRFFLYDCGLYTLEVKNKPGNAFRDTQRVYGPPPATNGTTVSPTHGANFYENENMPRQFSLEDLHTYFIKDKNWHYLLGTAMTWFFLDVSFYGFSLDNPASFLTCGPRRGVSTLGRSSTAGTRRCLAGLRSCRAGRRTGCRPGRRTRHSRATPSTRRSSSRPSSIC